MKIHFGICTKIITRFIKNCMKKEKLKNQPLEENGLKIWYEEIDYKE